jgi:hypothetical protein
MRRRARPLKTRTTYYFVFRPSDEGMPIMPLGNDTDWVLRANKHYGLTLGTRRTREDELNLAEVVEVDNPIVLHKIIEYLHFYYNFTRYDGCIGGPMRFRVPRTLADLEFSGASEEERNQALGALWRFLDTRGTGQMQPAVGTVIRLINRCHADVPMQIGSLLWRLRVSLRLRSGYVRLYGQVPFFHSPNLVPPAATEVRVLPPPWRLFLWEPWLMIPARMRAAIGALTYFALATSWLVAVLASLGFALTFLFHPLLVVQGQKLLCLVAAARMGSPFPLRGLCHRRVRIGRSLCVPVRRCPQASVEDRARIAARCLRGLERLQRYVWDWFKPRLQSPLKKTGTAALWLLVSSVFLILSFTALQVAVDPAGYAGDEAGQRVLKTFFGHATIAFPGVPYLLGAIGFDPLEWLRDPDMKSAMVLGFRVMMLIVVFRAFWKLLGYASPRILNRDSRRLEHELAKLRKPARTRSAAGPAAASRATAPVP